MNAAPGANSTSPASTRAANRPSSTAGGTPIATGLAAVTPAGIATARRRTIRANPTKARIASHSAATTRTTGSRTRSGSRHSIFRTPRRTRRSPPGGGGTISSGTAGAGPAAFASPACDNPANTAASARYSTITNPVFARSCRKNPTWSPHRACNAWHSSNASR